MPADQLRSFPVKKMGLSLKIFSALLLCGFCRGGPTPLPPQSSTCWVMGNFYSTFDSSYYTFMGNCTYTFAKNSHVSETLPAFEVETRNINNPNVDVTSTGAVTVSVYGFNIEILQSETGIVRVNYQQWNLPISLNNGQVTLSQVGLYVVIDTDFGLSVLYDWNRYLAVTLPDSFAGSVGGLCGNFNNQNNDDLTTPDGTVASSPAALAESWRVSGVSDDAYCQDQCAGACLQNCPLSVSEELEKRLYCNAIVQDFDQLLGCQPEVSSDDFVSNCLTDLCRGEAEDTYLCNAAQSFAYMCKKSGAKVPDWRTASQCSVPTCPENSHYEFCGSGCPATCANLNASSNCNLTCVETCVCNDGFVLSGTKCVTAAQCGCVYEGYYVEAGASFYGGESCTERYTCSAGGNLSSQQTSCPSGQLCQVVGGIRGCYPINDATCMVSGDPHFVTFDGEAYNFQGTCAYEMAGVSNQTSLEHFSVVLQNSGQDKKSGSAVQLVEVSVNGYSITINKTQPGTVVVNGELYNLPLALDNNTLNIHRSGWFAVIETDFGVKVYYNWNGVVFVIIPSAYKGVMQGLCGNYNLNPNDDMQMRNGEQAATPQDLGQSWNVATTPGCVNGCTSPCPVCNATQRATYNSSSYCGLISDPTGPFRDCQSIVDPAGFLNDCLYDVCLNQGSGNMQCKTLTAYTAACQLKGATVYSWRSALMCEAQCPSNSHYELCTNDCLGSCLTNSTLLNCGAQCMEGCVCDEGYLLSGDECVPADQCGCISDGQYYQYGQVFYPDALCQTQCTCNGTVQCQQSSCGPYEQCVVTNNVRSCQPSGKGVCSISGDPHYNTFDNSTYNFQGTCTYIAAESCHLNGTQLTSFSVAVENDKWYRLSADPTVSVTKLVAVEVYGTVVVLRRNEVNMVWINGVIHHLPQSLLNGALQVYQEGANDVIITDFGLRVTYDLVYHVTVTVPGSYWGRTCGLCGNYSDSNTGGFELPDGTKTTDTQTFAAAWLLPVPGVVCEDGCRGDLCPTCSETELAAIEAKCAIITDSSGPFAACQSVINPAPYFRDCVYDVCMDNDNQTMLCHSIAAYMLDCQDFGVRVQNWRSSSFCSFPCSAGSHYETCTMPCSSSTCPGLHETGTCSTSCVEGCACDDGLYFNGTGCVPFDDCSCYYNGQTYKIGQSVVTDDCTRINTCQTSGVVLSRNMSCDPNESCMVKNGVMGCYIQQCLLDSNGTLTAFNGLSGTITSQGYYEIIQNCIQSQTSEWFRVVVNLQMCSPGVNTLLAVYVYFNEMMITLSNKHGIWINGEAMTQTTFSQNNVNVVVLNNTVSINSNSALQLSFSSSDELTISVSDDVAYSACGACGSLVHPSSTTQDLREKVLVSLHDLNIEFASLDIGKWTAPDFPTCD